MKSKPTLRTCENGHKYYKSSDCPSCPVCEAQSKPGSGFLSLLSSPARNALVHEGITSVEKLAGYSEKEILSIHGIGPASLPALRKVLAGENRQFRKP